MQPAGLTCQIGKRYGEQGRTMIIRRCKNVVSYLSTVSRRCDRNDVGYLQLSQQLDLRVRADMDTAGIQPITTAAFGYAQLFGKN
jgi:hypothetical protein